MVGANSDSRLLLIPTYLVQTKYVGRVEERNPTNHDEYQTRIRPSAFGVDLDT